MNLLENPREEHGGIFMATLTSRKLGGFVRIDDFDMSPIFEDAVD